MRQEAGPTASVIVRAKDKATTIERTLQLLRAQTVDVEIIVVDSGSTDGTRAIARRWCDRLLDIAPGDFTYGRALNAGARAAAAPFHFAVSAHCFTERQDWVERALAHYRDPHVAGVCGYSGTAPDGRANEVIHQDAVLFQLDPFWGFTNHASSWRADVWRRFPFDEQIAAAEDKEWSQRVLAEDWVIALDPALSVSTAHRFEDGPLGFFRLSRRDVRAVAGFARVPPYGLRAVMRDWWNPPRDGRSRMRVRASPWHLAAVTARYAGLRDARRAIGTD
jgi:rhamnosyltransferase